MRIAIIDCGTNTFNLLIAEIQSTQHAIIFEDKIPVKIGKGGIENKVIIEEAYQRALDAMKVYAEAIKKYQVNQVIATSTSAFRSTDNGPQLKEDILQQTGIEVQIISGDEEADYIYQGVTWALPPEREVTYLIMDIGGGSTEFILYRNSEVLFRESYLLGASRLVEKFKPADPLSKKDVENYYQYFNEVLGETLLKVCANYPPDILVGSSGFFDTLRKICFYQFLQNDPQILEQTNVPIEVAHFNTCYQMMLPMDLEQRMNIKGMTAFRAELMGVSMLLVDEVIKRTGVKSIINTTYSLKEGVLRKYIES